MVKMRVRVNMVFSSLGMLFGSRRLWKNFLYIGRNVIVLLYTSCKNSDMSDAEIRIAMWSGPRNISTAMMRSWGNRGDCYVTDEPLYAHYLKVTGYDHPGAAETIAYHETDWEKVVGWLTGEIPEGKRVWYQKQMAHHLLPNVGRAWLSKLTNCFLIREPREMITSLMEFIPEPTFEDTGVPQQLEIFNSVVESTGSRPPVVDSKDVLDDPKKVLGALCEKLGLEFTDDMLSWEAGIRETDGIWAKHWYRKVEPTTGFGKYRPKPDQVPAKLQHVLDQCNEVYEEMYANRITG